uniref:GH10 domain-containing protein n=2 Tax=Kalanchoe fedtschenkoi TaxID=63787 RepID=A0A7N0UMP0_KALFE
MKAFFCCCRCFTRTQLPGADPTRNRSLIGEEGEMGVSEMVKKENGDYVNSKDGAGSSSDSTSGILKNHDFSRGLESWHANCCRGFVVSCAVDHPEGMYDKPVGGYAVCTDRRESWQGLEQDITSKVSPGVAYTVSANVGASGPSDGHTDILATLKLECQNAATQYVFVGRCSVSKGRWGKLDGTFTLSSVPDRVVFYLEGPPPGVDLLVQHVIISRPCPIETGAAGLKDGDDNIILNPNFEDGTNNWTGRNCPVARYESMADGKVLPQTGKYFAAATQRTQDWNGIQQEITGRVQRKLAYEVTALVRINGAANATIRATLYVRLADSREQYVGIANVQATAENWVQLQGRFLLNPSPLTVMVYLEGPPAGIDILVNSFVVKHAAKVPPSPPPVIENPNYGVNILQNAALTDGTNSWTPLGNCTLSVATGSPRILPPAARDSVGAHARLNGNYILVTNRTQTWNGPSQMITDKVKLFLTYQVSAWVRAGRGGSGPQNVGVALSVDGQWVNGGQAEIEDDLWHEISGSFRIEKQPAREVMVYVQGPVSGVDLMVAGLQIFAVDRAARFRHLKKQTEKMRKRDVVLKFTGPGASGVAGTFVKVRQTQNSFPFGTMISRMNIDNEDFVDFFTKNFSWAVFGNELKWYWTESQRGSFNYRDADELVELCDAQGISLRGHCIFWEVVDVVQQWVRLLSDSDLAAAVQSRLTGLLGRYKGKFKHYDVNNEMLHGSFFQSRLGKDVRASMFKTAAQLDPSATLFVNDYHVEDGADTRSTPEKYIAQILDLQEQGAPVGGIGVQGHIDFPVGPIISLALDKLGILGLPIWFTELDVSSVNEHVRAEDLEVMMREIFAHPAVEGIVLWGFWELFMSRDNAHLVNAEGEVNEAGKRYLALRQEWMTNAHGHIDQEIEFGFRGFQGAYEVQIVVNSKKIKKTFMVDKGDSPALITIDL